MENHNHGSQLSCFREWMNLQEQDLEELLQARNLSNADGVGDHTAQLTELIDKNIQHFQEYISRRATRAQDDISPFFSPTWCTTLEGSMLWAGGCRPSKFIRLVYALSGKEIMVHLEEYLNGRDIDGLGGLSASQISSMNELQLKTVRDEDKLSSKLASLQEEIADKPIAIIAEELRELREDSLEANEALNRHAISMRGLLEEADNLRLNTVKELTGIMTPVQTVHFLAAARKLHLCVHAWGRKRDQEHGRT